MAPASPQPLDGLRIVDLGTGMAPALAARMLADHGATVLRFEAPAGDPFEAIYPAYRHWHAKAERRPFSAAALDEALADADLCIVGGEDHPELDRRQDAEAIARDHPSLVVLAFAGAPEGAGPLPAVEILAQARSGFVFTHYPDRPLHFALPVASYGAALHGVIGALAALWARGESGDGEVVSTSLLQGALRWAASIWVDAERPSAAFASLSPLGVLPMRFRCADGLHVALAPSGIAGGTAALYDVLGIDSSHLDPKGRGRPSGSDPRLFFGEIDLIQKHIASWRQQDLLEQMRARGIPAAPVRLPGAAWNDPQTVENGIIARDEDGTRGIGSPFRIVPGDAAAPAAARQGTKGGKGPLAGVRVVDLGSFAAGPHASVVLRDLGAEVIKIERPEGDPMRPQFHHYAASNRGKKSIAIDAKSREGADLIRRLCASADAVHHNFRAGVASRLGLDFAALAEAHPGIVVLESPAYGATGPRSHEGGFDSVLQAETGHQPGAGGEGNEPLSYRFAPVDYSTGVLGALGMLLGLLQRQRQGCGAAIYSSLFNAGLYLLSELVEAPDGSFHGAPVNTASQLGLNPAESLYQVADGWIAIAARGEAMARRLAGLVGADALAGPAAGWGEDAERAIAALLAPLPADEALALLRRHDIWAEACAADPGTVAREPWAEQAGLLVSFEHPELGRFGQIAAPVVFARNAPSRQGCGAIDPVGGHSRAILAGAGLDDAAAEDLVARGLVR